VEAEPWLNRIAVRQLAAGAAATTSVAAVAVALVVGLSGSSKPVHHSRPAHATAPRSSAGSSSNPSGGVPISPTAAVPHIYWLGMEILDTPLGAVVNTITLGSQGDKDGFYPGDAIAAIDSTQVSSVSQLRAALSQIPIGQTVQVTLTLGSGSLIENVKLTKRPTDKP
jgi:S1-C subfamily serine protease